MATKFCLLTSMYSCVICNVRLFKLCNFVWYICLSLRDGKDLVQSSWSLFLQRFIPIRIYGVGDNVAAIFGGISWVPFYSNILTFIPEWTRNRMPSKMCVCGRGGSGEGGGGGIHPSPLNAAYNMRQWTGSALDQITTFRQSGAKTLPDPILTYCQLNT